MKTKHKIAIAFLCGIAFVCVLAGTKISALSRTATLAGLTTNDVVVGNTNVGVGTEATVRIPIDSLAWRVFGATPGLNLSNRTVAASNYFEVGLSNRVRVAAGSGGITVTPSGNGGVMTFTIDDDDAGSGGSDAGGTNARQFGSLNLTNWSNIPTGAMANIPAMAWATNRIGAALTNDHSVAVTLADDLDVGGTITAAAVVIGVSDVADEFNALEADIANLQAATNAIDTRLVTVSNRTWAADSWATNRHAAAITNNHSVPVTFSTNLNVGGTNVAMAFRGSGDGPGTLQIDHGYFNTNLHAGEIVGTNALTLLNATASRVAVFNGAQQVTNSAAVSTTELEFLDGVTSAIQTQLDARAGIASATFLTNWSGAISNLTQTKQNGSAALTNLSGLPNFAFTNVITKTTATVSGAGSGSTNYLLTLSTNALNDFYLGSSNVHIYTVAGSTLGSPIYWTAIITNLSGNTWGINFASGTNRWRFSGVYGTNAPSVLTNGTALMLSGRTDGTNCLLGYTYFAPGL